MKEPKYRHNDAFVLHCNTIRLFLIYKNITSFLLCKNALKEPIVSFLFRRVSVPVARGLRVPLSQAPESYSGADKRCLSHYSKRLPTRMAPLSLCKPEQRMITGTLAAA